MAFDFVNIVLLFGGLQALLLVVGINLRKPLMGIKKRATTFMLLVILIAMIYYIVITYKWSEVYKVTWILGNVAWMALLPSFYLFVRSLIVPEAKFGWKKLVYFSVPIFFLLNDFGLLIFGYNLMSWSAIRPHYLDVWMFVFFLNSSFFTYQSFRLLKNYQNHELNKILLRFTRAIMAILIVYAVAYLITRHNYSFYFELSLICIFEILIFGMVFRTFRLAPTHTLFAEPKYQNLTVKSPTDFTHLHQHISDTIDQAELFRDPKLNLSKLAQQVGVSQNQLSQYFNIGLNSSFYAYINEKRLLYVEDLIRKGEHKELTISGLAFESGFNSKTTFYKVFKEKHGLTPTQFIHKNES